MIGRVLRRWRRLFAVGGGRARLTLVDLVCDDRGAVTVNFIITLSAIVLVVAVAIDFARTQTAVVRAQNALAGAALAASDRLGLPDQDAAGRGDAESNFKVNTIKPKDVGVLKDVVLDAEKGGSVAPAKGNMLTSLLVGIKAIGIASSASLARGHGSVEVALVLDTSASMAGQSIADLRVAAQNLTSVLYAGYEGTDKVRVGIVPFAGSVNVGSAHQAASWMDSAGLSPTHYENFAEQRSRFQLFTQLGVKWGGCVEVRPSPHDVSDSLPAASVPASLFVPMFAPDEPDSANAEGNAYSNNYLSDTGGGCSAPPQTCLRSNRRGRCTSWSTPALPAAQAQARTCKYDGAVIVSASGPNALCDAAPILPLTESKSAVHDAIGQMRAKGSTNMLEGLMWGWRVLSPEEPFTHGRPYSDRENTKYLILMTDGENNHQAMSNHNKSIYHAFGYASNGRLGTGSSSAALSSQMNSKTRAACENAKAAGITIYTIAFRLEQDANTRALLASCASSAAEAYLASNGASLVQAFEAIAREIAKLRIAS
jgi:Mg-chelatase subunit ChlD